jgi:hypothetical protein
MSNTVQAHQPAVVARSNYRYLRTLAAIATIVIVGLAVAVAVLAINSSSTTANPGGQINPSAITNYPGHY